MTCEYVVLLRLQWLLPQRRLHLVRHIAGLAVAVGATQGVRNASSSRIPGGATGTTWAFGPPSLTNRAPTSVRRCPMSAKRVTLALGVTAAALTVAAVSVHATPVGTAANPEKIKFISRATPVNTVVDVGPAGSSPGDIYVFVDDVFLTTAPSTQVGQ